ncbi:LPS O-antigen length regulator [Vibrio parahaemolyticus]|uniref:Wzz/FepE/Etk N-terminal domain-containing protein n=1 Tax=Vibrio parahaemolyticus TaxID=670 RepID=UPI0005F15762|nr:Wzz/FepE/Etk N-terminal domain-containing protein [Vibrio parahaemolyticus]EHZ2782115.1 LPS O-antigen length regulator [Vibrio parahaemolyticus]ELA7192405.1 LPS O-antigen length regulator [Vibrio parahaemolyticus]HAS6471960.1 LPS O-antigen length regulator [Vibrio parahaemolyticus]
MEKNQFEVDISELVRLLWTQKWLIISITFTFAVASVLFAISKPNIYKSEAVLFPVTDNSTSSAMGQLGGLAALAGFGGKESSKQAIALEALRSRAFLGSFIERHDILIPLMAIDSWDASARRIIIDPEIYDESTGVWTRTVGEGKQPEPTRLEAIKFFNELLSIDFNKVSGATIISLTNQSPELAEQWLAWLISDLNEWMKNKDIVQAKKNIEYLDKQLKLTNLSEMQNVFYQLIEEQTKKLMLAEAQDQYIFEMIDPPVVPEEKDSPSRAIICVLGTLIGGILSIFIALIRIAVKRKNA